MFTNELVQNCVRSLEGRILPSWVKAITKEGQLYYLNHEHKISQWDHPEYIKMMKDISVINSVKYAAYRTAFKLRHLQTRLKCHELSLDCISSAFNKEGFLPEKNIRYVTNKEIEKIILFCYKTAFKHKPLDLHLCTDLLMNMLINTFDESRIGKIQILKLKVFLVVMGGGRLQEKYKYLFNEIADQNHGVSRKKLAKVLLILSSVAEFVSEEFYFGSSFVPGAVESCFKNVSDDVGISETAFLDWVLQEPQTLLWWSTLYRISMAELVCHDVRCSTCKERPIIGMRYQCLKCLGYNLCQDCFLHGRNSKNHKLSHPLQEYCQESTGKEWGISLLKIMHHHLKFKHSLVKPRYLTISSSEKTISLLQDTDDDSFQSEAIELNDENSFSSQDSPSDISEPNQTSIDITKFLTTENLNNESNAISKLITSEQSTPRKELNSVIKHLEDGEKLLSRKLFNCNNSEKTVPTDLIERHREELQTQINRLKNILYTYSQTPKPLSGKFPNGKGPFLPRFESTPVVNGRALHPVLSPIETLSNTNEILFENQENNHDEESKNSFDVLSLSCHSKQKSFGSSEEEVTLSTFTQTYLPETNGSISASELEFCTTKKKDGRVSNISELNLSDLKYKDGYSSSNTQFAVNSPKDGENSKNKGENSVSTKLCFEQSNESFSRLPEVNSNDLKHEDSKDSSCNTQFAVSSPKNGESSVSTNLCYKESNESVSLLPKLNLSDLKYKEKEDCNSSYITQFAVSSPVNGESYKNTGNNSDSLNLCFEESDSLDKKFADLEQELHQLLTNIDEMFKSPADENSVIDPSIISCVSEIIDSFIGFDDIQ